MAETPTSRFTAQNKSTHERLSTTTVGLVELSDFRKRRAEVLEQQEREAREKALGGAGGGNGISSSSGNNADGISTPGGGGGPDRSLSGTPVGNASDSGAGGGGGSDVDRQQPKRKKKKTAARTKVLVSFGEEVEEDENQGVRKKGKSKEKEKEKEAEKEAENGEGEDGSSEQDESNKERSGSKPRTSSLSPMPVGPRVMTKAALKREAAEREALRKEFLVLQAAVKATEIAIPFVFYDGTNIPGGVVRIKKGDFVWMFLDKSRKVGARLGVGGQRVSNARRAWARVSVDDLLMVRGSIIIPHHYEFYFFIMNKSIGPGNQLLFNYKAEAPPQDPDAQPAAGLIENPSNSKDGTGRPHASISTLEGAKEDPSFTKVVDRRWYDRNKHIYPANTWQEFDPEKDYQNEIRRDPGGNAFFFSK